MASKKTKPKVKVTQNTPPLFQVHNQTKAKEISEQVWFNLSDHKWMSSVKLRGYTNFVHNSEDGFSNLYTILSSTIPKVMNEWDVIIKNPWAYPHCHIVVEKKVELVRSVYKEIYKSDLDEGLKLWQLGFKQGVRLICIHNTANNSLVPIFIDHNHLLHPSEKHNEHDTGNFSYCLICSQEKKSPN